MFSISMFKLRSASTSKSNSPFRAWMSPAFQPCSLAKSTLVSKPSLVAVANGAPVESTTQW